MKTIRERLESIHSLIMPTKSCTRHDAYIDCSPHQGTKSSCPTTSGSTSSHQYPPELQELIKDRECSWVLDCGSGARDRDYENVVNFEILPYSGVDVVGVAEELPFSDETFDLVFSLAVLEHVKDPQKAVREMKRVLKPEGLLWIDTAFLQPYHGYPSHYFNMTQQGLELLLGSEMQIVRDEVPRYGTPIWSLTWIISKYANSLPPTIREHFLSLSLSELLKSPEILCEEKFATELPEESRKELAATVSVLAKKI